MKIREYKNSDRDEVKEMVGEILAEIFNGEPSGFKLLKEFRVRKDYLLFLVAEIDGKVVGTMALKKIKNNVVQLKRMYVRKGYEGRGIAKKLIEEITNFAKKNNYKKMILNIYRRWKTRTIFLKKMVLLRRLARTLN